MFLLERSQEPVQSQRNYGQVRVLADPHPPSGRRLVGDDFILVQDNDPKHTSIMYRNYLRTQKIDGSLAPSKPRPELDRTIQRRKEKR